MDHHLVLTFPLAKDQIGRLRTLAVLKRGTRGRTVTRRATETHFDTPGRDLLKRHISVRVELVGRQRTQHVALRGPRLGPANEYRVWSGPVPTPDPMLAAIEDSAVSSLLAEAETSGGAPIPVFSTEVERTERHLALEDEALVLVRIETGLMRAGESEKPVHRLQLILEHGPATTLFALGQAVMAALPIRPAAHNPAALGMDLSTGASPAWHKRRPLRLTRSETVEEAMVQMLRFGLDHALANEAAVLENDHPEGIHQMRVGLRRTRSALRLFRKLLPPDQYVWFNGEVKWITDQLGPARDMDVFEDEIVGPIVEHLSDPGVLDGLRNRIRRRRTMCRRKAREALRSERYATFGMEAARWLAERTWRETWGNDLPTRLDAPILGLASKLVGKRHKAVHEDGTVFDALSIEQRHQLRIDVKKLRYAIDFFGALYPEEAVTAYLEHLSGLQDGLGYLNDVAVAKDLVALLCRTAKGDALVECRHAGGIVIGWHTKALADIEAHMSADVRTFLEAKPFWKARKSKKP